MRARANFAALFTPGGPDECWPWRGRVDREGYGRIWVQTYAHREAWERVNGPIPAGLVIDHVCRNRTCVNPDHMQVITRGENTALGRLRNTHCKHGHELTPENTYRPPSGRYRQCRTCRSDRERRAA